MHLQTVAASCGVAVVRYSHSPLKLHHMLLLKNVLNQTVVLTTGKGIVQPGAQQDGMETNNGRAGVRGGAREQRKSRGNEGLL